jgi:hypothetical protein
VKKGALKAILGILPSASWLADMPETPHRGSAATTTAIMDSEVSMICVCMTMADDGVVLSIIDIMEKMSLQESLLVNIMPLFKL